MVGGPRSRSQWGVLIRPVSPDEPLAPHSLALATLWVCLGCESRNGLWVGRQCSARSPCPLLGPGQRLVHSTLHHRAFLASARARWTVHSAETAGLGGSRCAADSAGPLAGSRAAVVLILTAAPQSGDGSPHSSGEAREVTQPERGRLGSRVSGVGCGHCMGLSLPGWKVSSGPLLPLGILVIPIL